MNQSNFVVDYSMFCCIDNQSNVVVGCIDHQSNVVVVGCIDHQ